MTFAKKVLQFYRGLKVKDPLPAGVDVLNPYSDPECLKACEAFYNKFYNDEHKRVLILGINPGRYGAGITGIPFTDPLKLETHFGIATALPKKPELSADFIHRMIAAFGGYEKFFSAFFINSVSPLGFMKAGKNLNYYDTPALKKSLEAFIHESISGLLQLDVHRHIVFCLGEGENYKYIQKMNGAYKWFDDIVPLAHPRFIMQYRRKRMMEYVEGYVRKLEISSNFKV